MWHADKPRFQHELAIRMARLIHSCPSVNVALEFLSVFFETLEREWEGIDRLRMDKYYSLLSITHNEALVLLQKHAWETGPWCFALGYSRGDSGEEGRGGEGGSGTTSVLFSMFLLLAGAALRLSAPIFSRSSHFIACLGPAELVHEYGAMLTLRLTPPPDEPVQCPLAIQLHLASELLSAIWLCDPAVYIAAPAVGG